MEPASIVVNFDALEDVRLGLRARDDVLARVRKFDYDERDKAISWLQS